MQLLQEANSQLAEIKAVAWNSRNYDIIKAQLEEAKLLLQEIKKFNLQKSNVVSSHCKFISHNY